MTGIEVVVIAAGVAVGFFVVRALIGSARQRGAEPVPLPPPPRDVSPSFGDFPPPMDPRFLDHLTRVVHDHGPFVGTDPKRLEGLLLDYALGRHRTEIRGAVTAARHGVPAMLHSGGPAAVSRAVAALRAQAGLDETLATWAVWTWSNALEHGGPQASTSTRRGQ